MKTQYKIIYEILKNFKKNKFLLIGIFYLLIQFFVFYLNYINNNYNAFFWFCNHICLILSIAFIFKKINIIKAIINFGFIGQLVWTIDFIGKFFFDIYLFNITNYIFENLNNIWIIIPIILHLFTINIALIFTYKYKPNILSILYSIIYSIILYLITSIYTIQEYNINWVFKIGGNLNYYSNIYTILWPLIVLFILIIPTYLFQILLYKIHIKNKTN